MSASTEGATAEDPPWPGRTPSETSTPDGRPRVFSKVRFLWIRSQPRPTADWIGYLAMGDEVALRSSEPVGRGSGDCARWYAVEPRGFVCVGEKTASLDPDDPDVRELTRRRAKPTPWPYDYGASLGTTVYLDVPPARRQYFRESAFHDHMALVERAKAAPEEHRAKVAPALLGVDLKPRSEPRPPSLLHLGPRSRPQMAGGKYGFPEIAAGSTVATAAAFDEGGRGWLMTWDRGIVPRDRVRSFAQSSFHGVALTDRTTLPMACLRREQRLFSVENGTAVPGKEVVARYTWIPVTSEIRELGERRYRVTRTGALVPVEAVSVPTRRAHPPPSVDAEGTWVDISIEGGWLVAYEGPRPVYATLISPGRGGLPVAGKTLLETASTPVGDFRIGGKFHTATMTSNYSEKVVHAEVPYTQNFSGPYALHAAYWHDDWGEGKSGGCVNLAPIDAMRLFAWTHPRLPAGWHGMRRLAADAAAYAHATVVSVHR